jgi:hypothetical protein
VIALLVARPIGISALSGFFALGMTMSGLAAVSLAFPGSLLEPMWQINPRGRAGLSALGPSGIALMATVSAVCFLAAIGLWSGRRWGRRVAMTMLVVNAVGDVLNGWTTGNPRTLIGLPIAGAMLYYLCSARVRDFFVAGRG